MIASMTGFARSEIAGPFGALICELRSVNHRFLDVALRLPDSCRALEPDLRQVLSRSVRRGKVDCSVYQRAPQGGGAGMEIDQPSLDRLLLRLNEVAGALPATARTGLHAQVNLVDLLRFPGVLREDTIDPETVLRAARTLFADTVAQLVAARAREGERLSALIEQRCAALAALVAGVRARLPEEHARIRQRFQERLHELEAQIDGERVEQEIVLLLQRGDIAEELDRLDGHVQEAASALKSEEPAGRRLDFLMQEFNREANTLSSKSMDLETTRAAMEMKVLIEQMREQVQNIE